MESLIVIEKVVEGVEMGVLGDGTAFLTSRGLARLCGVAPSSLIAQAAKWKEGRRDGKLARMLLDAGFDEPLMYIPTKRRGVIEHAFPAGVCSVVLHYYAYELGSEQARKVALILTRQTLQEYIYRYTGYDPRLAIPPAWRFVHDRLLLNVVPPGYFGVFKEMVDVVLVAMRHGLKVDEHTVPDISVGITWANFWTANNLEAQFGKRITYEHSYPGYMPQSDSNPQDVNCYPIEALGIFRKWLMDTYIPDRFPGYLKGKVSQGAMDREAATNVLAALDRDLRGLPVPPHALPK